MCEPVDDKEKRKYRAWEYPLKKWPRDEKFWMDMTTRTLSGIVSVGVIGTIVLLGGLQSTDNQERLLRISVFTIGALVLSLILLVLVVSVWTDYGPRKTIYFPAEGGASFRTGRGRLKDDFEMYHLTEPKDLPEWEIYKDRAFKWYAEQMSSPEYQGNSGWLLGISYHRLSDD